MADDKKEFDIEKYYKNLSRAFKGGSPVFRQRVANKITPPGQAHSPVGTARAFLKSTTNLYSSQLASYGMYSRLARYCLTGDSKVITNTKQGYLTIKELVERFEKGEKINTYAFDKERKEMVCVPVAKAWKTKVDEIWEIKFDDGLVLRCTKDHPIMLRDGTFCEAQKLKDGTAVMPFHRKEFKYDNKGNYRWVYCHRRGWVPEHRLVAELKYDTRIDKFDSREVHHQNFDRIDNSFENLLLWDRTEHRSYHAKLNNERFSDPAEREKQSLIAKKRWDENGDLRINLQKMIDQREQTPGWQKSLDRLQEYNKTEKPGKFNKDRQDQKRLQNANADRNFTFQDICNAYEKGMNVKKLCVKLDASYSKVIKRIKWQGFKGYSDFQQNYSNHKVISVCRTGKFEDVYDLMIDKYHNFAVGDFVDNSLKALIVSNSDYSEMESNSIITSALDIYSDEVCTKDEHGEMIKIFSHDAKIRKILDAFFYQVLNIDFNLWPWVRNFLKYGDQFLLVDHHPNHGVLQVLPMPVNEVEREEGFDQNDPLAYRYRWTTQGNRTLDPWQVIHFRNGGNDSFMPYGCSVIESVRRTWRQVVLLEDAVMTYRIVRSPERRVFYIDVGGIDPNDVPQFIEKVKGQLKRNNTVDATTGQLDKRYNPMSIMDDYYIPVRGDMTSTRIESLPGGQYVGDIDDLNYHRDKLFAGLKIPKSYLGYEGEVNARSTLSQEDINFARTIARLQNIVVAELNKMAIIQLYSAGYRGEELMNFELTMASPSIITEIQRLELWRTRFEVASVASSQEGSFDRRFAYKKLFKLSDEEIEEIEEGRRKDKLFDMELESIAPPVPPPGEVPPPPEGGVAAGEVPAAPGRSGEEPPPEGEQPSPEAITAGRDPNQQRIMPNDVKGKTKKRKNSNGLPTNLTQVFNFKKTALDPRDGLVQNMRVGSSPFGESLSMGRMLTEDIEDTDEEFSKQQLQMRLLRHEGLLRQLEGSQLEGIKGLPVKTSPAPVGAPVEPIEDKEKREQEDQLWQAAQKQEGE